MPRRGGPKHKPDTSDRTRAAEALRLRLSGMTWEAIQAQMGYRSVRGPAMAVERLLGRIEHEGAAQLRAVESRRLDELLAGVWPKAIAGDTDAVRTVLRISERRSKLLGLDAPVQVAVEGIGEQEFAERYAELLRVAGGPPRSMVEAALPALEPAERDAWISETHPAPLDDGLDGWSNIGGPEYARYTPSPYPSPHPEADSPPGGDSAPFRAAEDDAEHQDDEHQGDQDAAPAPVVVERGDDDDAPEAEVIAEVIPLPPGQRSIPASEVLDANGVPLARGGFARRLGGYGYGGRGGYDPLAGWRPR